MFRAIYVRLWQRVEKHDGSGLGGGSHWIFFDIYRFWIGRPNFHSGEGGRDVLLSLFKFWTVCSCAA